MLRVEIICCICRFFQCWKCLRHCRYDWLWWLMRFALLLLLMLVGVADKVVVVAKNLHLPTGVNWYARHNCSRFGAYFCFPEGTMALCTLQLQTRNFWQHSHNFYSSFYYHILSSVSFAMITSMLRIQMSLHQKLLSTIWEQVSVLLMSFNGLYLVYCGEPLIGTF